MEEGKKRTFEHKNSEGTTVKNMIDIFLNYKILSFLFSTKTWSHGITKVNFELNLPTSVSPVPKL